MSGGSFDYKCFAVSQFADELQHKIDVNNVPEKGSLFKKETVDALAKCHKLIEEAGVLAREIEWLYSGDHSEDSFLEIVGPLLKGMK